MALQIDTPALLSSLSTANLLPSPLIPETFTPSVRLTVSFNDKAVAAGNLFRSSDCKIAPTISFTPEVRWFAASSHPIDSTNAMPQANTSKDITYTVLLVDPDAPTPEDPKFAYWRHWVVSLVSQSDDASKDATKSGKTLTEYLGPGPKDDSKPHRYLFLLYREPAGLKELTKEDVGGEEFAQRRSFDAKVWTERYGLELVGVNWMLGAGDGWTDGKSEL